MRRIKLSLIGFLAAITGLVVAQPISDVAVIPVAITINTTMRINVVSGGNVEWVVNTLTQYENGIANLNTVAGSAADPIFDTRFTVASSRDFDVFMFAEDACFIGTDEADGSPNTIPLTNVGYTIHELGNHTEAGGEIDVNSLVTENVVSLSNTTTTLIISHASSSAGGTDDNDFVINWELATSRLESLTGIGDLLSQSIAQDRYITNVYLVLEPAD